MIIVQMSSWLRMDAVTKPPQPLIRGNSGVLCAKCISKYWFSCINAVRELGENLAGKTQTQLLPHD